ncbi:MAG: tRNA(Phe) 7-((3-amino-3-carboxypropyl)-4-demethylwyosine(37)-N(4))-methyltransferase [Acidilobus sp.]
MPGSQSDFRRVLLEERLVGYLDPGAERYLIPINEAGIRTSSSCTGRATLVEGEWHWLRDEARIVFKTHSEVSTADIARFLSGPFENLWLKVTGPILHVRLPELGCAARVLQAAREAGFKHSGVISLGKEVVVELLSAVQITIPLKINGVYVVDPRSLGQVVDMTNRALRNGWARLERLSQLLSALDCRQRTS